MSRTEFLEKLREALDQNVSPHVVRENVEYYGRYINEEMRKGRSEQEILEEEVTVIKRIRYSCVEAGKENLRKDRKSEKKRGPGCGDDSEGSYKSFRD